MISVTIRPAFCVVIFDFSGFSQCALGVETDQSRLMRLINADNFRTALRLRLLVISTFLGRKMKHALFEHAILYFH